MYIMKQDIIIHKCMTKFAAKDSVWAQTFLRETESNVHTCVAEVVNPWIGKAHQFIPSDTRSTLVSINATDHLANGIYINIVIARMRSTRGHSFDKVLPSNNHCEIRREHWERRAIYYSGKSQISQTCRG